MLKIRTKLRIVAAIAACLAVITMIASCEKEDDKVDVKLLDTETSGLYHMRKFMYDEQYRIKEIWTYSGGVLFEKEILTYTGEDLTKYEYAYLVEGKVVSMNTRNYIKKGNTISWSDGVEIIEGEDMGSQNFTCTITLNDDGYPKKLEQGLLNITSVSTFTYVKGNLTKYSYDTVFSSDSNDPGERNYTYGKNRSAYSSCKTPKWFLLLRYFEMASHNAVIKSSYPATTYSYEFDSDGFPTTYTRKFWGMSYTSEFQYKY